MKSIYIAILIFVMSNSIFAQYYRPITGLSYNMGLTTGSTKDFADDYSWRGLGIDYKRFTDRNISVGFSTGWNIFDQKVRGLINLERGAVSGLQVRHINAFPILVNANYHFDSRESQVKPYVGFNIGTYYIIQRFDIGVITIEEDNWHFGIAPELGFIIPFGYMFTTWSVKFNYAFAAGKSIAGDAKDYSYWGFNIGFAVPSW